jgi:Coenzyme PQQ synthesis protein D (PqqD)
MPATLNLLELRPIRNARSETAEDGLVTLVVPKFRSVFLQKWLVPWLAKPNFRIRLDNVGSFIWQRCDGTTPVLKIAEEMQSEFGEGIQPVYDRISRFLNKLESSQFILIRK